ncbi:MAG: hypothetical protein ABIA93_01165 [Candidatus Woesearchaeota archaeon]
MNINAQKLLEKGWTPAEIRNAQGIIERANKPKHIHLLDHAVYWITMLLAIAGNAFMAVWLVPLLVVLPALPLYGILIITGGALGSFFTMLILMIEKADHKRHLFILGIVPTLAALSFIAVAGTLKVFPGSASHHPILVGAVYALAFLVPYVTVLRGKNAT